ncbi:5'/3'-nucleotidase SurE [Sagittula salina]|uniref:5'-nucleotidase SurE n=1 Tax=Sagittula salina TaxID=2820268 RepID=A0A940MG85_9RHOB|nr:5'/3'-nucleotidase SurE [Sagittula salina]MBP0480956.1 5'/3'-nucleotidase SurE [Sagittula salina]
MRILITNDDGINAPGLKVLEAIAGDLAGPDGEVWTVAPAFEQSGVAHCISYAHPTMISELGTRRYAAEGSPADCVLAGVHDVLLGHPIDLVLSGVNRGNNSAENALYSGTLGGALEGALQGLRAIALSQYLGPRNNHIDDPFEAAARFGAETVRRVLDFDAASSGNEPGYRLFYNVNFPPVPAAEVKGLKACPQGIRENTRFSVEAQLSPSKRRFLWAKGGDQRAPVAAGTDAALNLAGWISVTPMRADLTCHASVSALQASLGTTDA